MYFDPKRIIFAAQCIAAAPKTSDKAVYTKGYVLSLSVCSAGIVLHTFLNILFSRGNYSRNLMLV